MSRKPYAALGVFPSAAGSIVVRKVYSRKQSSWLLVCEGPHAGLRQLLPEWRPRAPSTRTQLTPPKPIKKVCDLLAFYQQHVPIWYERLAGKPLPTANAAAPSLSYRTLGELMKIVDHEAETSLRTGSLTTYRYQWAALNRVLPRDTVLTELTREKLQSVIGELSATYASTTVTNIRNVLSKLLVRAVEDHVLTANVLTKVKCPKPVSRQHSVLSRTQRDLVLREAEARGRDVQLLFHILLGTGARRSEALALTWQDVDLEHRLLHIRSSEHFLTKTGGARSVPIPGDLFALLSRHARAAGFVLKPDQPYGNGRYRWDFSKGFAAVVTAAGVPWVTPHTCRHHYASWYLEQGGSLFRLATYLGHAVVETTQQYAHLVPGFGAEVDQGTASAGSRSMSA